MRNVIDLFAGAGGLSLGAARAGFRVKGAVDTDNDALDTHKRNFPSTKHSNANVSTLSGSDLLDLTKLKRNSVDGLIGGAPCQGFSVIGKRKRRDDRNNLFVEFFRLVQETSPAFFLTENVPNILNTRYDSLREKALSKLKKQYVVLEPLAINASDYGAPTSRRRIFFVGYKPKEFSSELTASCFALKRKDRTLCVRDALQGLPVDISPDWLTEELGWHPVKKLENNYFFRRTSGNIPTGVGEAKSVERYCKKNEVSGCMGTRHSVDVEERYRGLAYGRRDPVSRSTKLDPDGYCPTLRAGTGRDRGRFQAVRPIHYDPPRVITPREAARLQGFPDWFVFHATKWHSFRQIGSSVSPIVSERLLRVIFERL